MTKFTIKSESLPPARRHGIAAHEPAMPVVAPAVANVVHAVTGRSFCRRPLEQTA